MIMYDNKNYCKGIVRKRKDSISNVGILMGYSTFIVGYIMYVGILTKTSNITTISTSIEYGETFNPNLWKIQVSRDSPSISKCMKVIASLSIFKNKRKPHTAKRH